MKKEIAELLVDGFILKLHENYSGRGMYGENTAGISCDNMRQFMEAIGNTFYEMIEDAMIDGEEYNTSDAEDLVDVLSNLQTDNLGRRIIIY